MDDQASAPAADLAVVAARAGVSVSTASLVFSGRGPVAASTRDRVLAAAAALDYAGPDPTARSLRRGSTGVIGVVTEDSLAESFRDPMNLALLDGIGEGLGDERLGLLVIPRVSDPGIDLAAAPVDAAILLGCSTDVAPSVAALRQRRDSGGRDRGGPDARTSWRSTWTTATRAAAAPSTCAPSVTAGSASSPCRSTRTAPAARSPPSAWPLRPHTRRSNVWPACARCCPMPSPTRRPAARSTRARGSRALLLDVPAARPSDGDRRAERPARGRRDPRRRAARTRGPRATLSVLGFDGVRLEGRDRRTCSPPWSSPRSRRGGPRPPRCSPNSPANAVRAVLLHTELRIGTTTGPAPDR